MSKSALRFQPESKFRKFPTKESFVREKAKEPIKALTQTQDIYLSSLYALPNEEDGSDAFVFAIGSAGSGKTFLASSVACDLFQSGDYNTIIIARPTVSCGEDLGALPGSLSEKYDPWIQAVTDPIKQRIGAGAFDCNFGRNIIAVPLQFMRGKTFDDAFIIVDEAQNLTVEQAEMAMTRIGQRSKMVFCGDTKQTDHKYVRGVKIQSGLTIAINEIERQREPGIDIIRFTQKDCVRSPACAKAIKIFEKVTT